MSAHKKTAKTIVDAEGHPVHAEGGTKPLDFGFEIPPPSLFVDLARMGVQMGIGLAAMTFEGVQKIALEAIDRGAKIEKTGIESVKTFEREQVTSMKEYLSKVKGKAKQEVSIEAHVEEALRTHDVPTRDDIRELNHKITALDAKLTKLAK